jgi:hypothetical protein
MSLEKVLQRAIEKGSANCAKHTHINKSRLYLSIKLAHMPPEGEAAQGEYPLTPSRAKFQINLLNQRGPDEAPERPQRGGNARKIQKNSFMNRWFELHF